MKLLQKRYGMNGPIDDNASRKALRNSDEATQHRRDSLDRVLRPRWPHCTGFEPLIHHGVLRSDQALAQYLEDGVLVRKIPIQSGGRHARSTANQIGREFLEAHLAEQFSGCFENVFVSILAAGL